MNVAISEIILTFHNASPPLWCYAVYEILKKDFAQTGAVEQLFGYIVSLSYKL